MEKFISREEYLIGKFEEWMNENDSCDYHFTKNGKYTKHKEFHYKRVEKLLKDLERAKKEKCCLTSNDNFGEVKFCDSCSFTKINTGGFKYIKHLTKEECFNESGRPEGINSFKLTIEQVIDEVLSKYKIKDKSILEDKLVILGGSLKE